MTTFELWQYFYINDLCTKETLQLLVQLKTLTQDQYNTIIASKPDLTGRIVVPIGTDTNTTGTAPADSTGTAPATDTNKSSSAANAATPAATDTNTPPAATGANTADNTAAPVADTKTDTDTTPAAQG